MIATFPYIRSSPSYVSKPDDFINDSLALFSGKMQGHMERWEYGPSQFLNDPAGGGAYWAELVKNPGQYYLTQSDIDTIQWAVRQDKLLKALSGIETVVELGPGSYEAIHRKTIPFLQTCPRLKKYVAIDATIEQATTAARIVHENLSIETGVRGQDYMSFPLLSVGTRKSAVVMWGSSIGNIDGPANSNPIIKLIQIFERFKAGLKIGDMLIVCFDTEIDENKISNAYNELALRAQILSVIHRLKRDGYATGQFDPRLWAHESVWFPDVGQCAHMIYPLFDQAINIAGHTFKIPAWRRFISNNSYKFSPATMETAATRAGLKPIACLQNGSIALFIAESR